MNPYRLSRARQRLLAGAILLVVLGLVSVATALPAADLLSGRKASLEQAEQELARWQGVAASRSLIETAADDPALANRLAALALHTPSQTQAVSALQAHARRILVDAGTDLKSIQPLETRAPSGLPETGVRIVALATHKQFQDAVFALENASPRMFLREANIQVASGRRSAMDPDEETLLQVRLDIFAFVITPE